MVNTPTINNSADMFETPGQVLRLQREELKLSIEEIAKRIHLDVKVIDSIENDKQEGMPSAIYVRGYLRSYAKAVGADADKIIELYNADSPPPPPEILPEVKPASQVSSNDKPVKAFTYLITLGLVLLLLIWYQSNFVVNTQTSNGQLDTETSINGVDTTYNIVVHPDSWQTPNNYAEESMDPEPETSLLSITNDISELQMYSEKETIETTLTEASDDKLSSSTTETGSDTINIKLTSDSWIEISDKNNNRLFHDLALAGKEYNINGTAPLTVLLGFSKGVALEFNGKPFDVESYSKAGVAHFTLPE